MYSEFSTQLIIQKSSHIESIPSTPPQGGVGGCDGDYLTIEEGGLARRGGRWCGESQGLNIYYSDSPSVTLTIHTRGEATQGEYFDNPLSLKLR